MFKIFLKFYLELELFAKIKKDLVFTYSQNLGLSITERETCANFSKKYYSLVVGARQSFQFFRQIPWFLGNNRALSQFKYWILHCFISYQITKQLVCKTQFHINHTSNLLVIQGLVIVSYYQREYSWYTWKLQLLDIAK